MKKVKFKDLNISLLGFGTMRFPILDGEIDKVEAAAMMDYAYDNGVNYFDTAWFYHDYKSESFMGEYLSTKERGSYYLATKLPIWLCESIEDVDKYFNSQLENLKVDYFDFYLVHAMNEARFAQLVTMGVLDRLLQLKQEGKIKHLGFSFHDDYPVFEKIVEYHNWDFAQIQLNYMDTEHQQGIKGLNLLNDKKIPAIIMEPIKGGKLANFNDEINTKFKLQDNNSSIASWAFRWIASRPGVFTVLSGMTTMEQVQDNIMTFTDFKPMNTQELSFIDSVKNDIKSKQINLCTSCQYCMPCPYGVNIPRNLGAQNDAAMYGEQHVEKLIQHLKKTDSFASFCVDCGECLPKCPQQIEIPDMLREMV